MTVRPTINLERDDFAIRVEGPVRIQDGSEGWYCIGKNRFAWHLCVVREKPDDPTYAPAAVKLCQIVDPLDGQGVTYWHGPFRVPEPGFRNAPVCLECLQMDPAARMALA